MQARTGLALERLARDRMQCTPGKLQMDFSMSNGFWYCRTQTAFFS